MFFYAVYALPLIPDDVEVAVHADEPHVIEGRPTSQGADGGDSVTQDPETGNEETLSLKDA